MATQSSVEANPKSTTIVDAIVTPPLPNWKELRDLPAPSGPLPEDEEDDEDDATSKEETLKPKEVKEAKESEEGDKSEKV
ncbi:hypothetical protein J4E85_005971 [Alternaria conjuncta]|uniref:uncharacterized protein n=1 Tax=Alternaria conjuncta TaxID=181017 RepID=UPI00221FFF5E|nr:uncharacterized protein J4E85_005971 [Alternaria conjuncta]KAI4927460.1 hypothetical protein J4E85_005971 [Alternaria conjuncta]